MTGQALTFDATPEELVVFLSEAEEQLELLSHDILRLEQEGDTNSELLQGIFRAAHTSKGSSGAIGHQRMARLTHALETVLDHVRHHTLPISTHLIDLLLQGVDALRVLLDEVTTLVESDINIDSVCSGLIALASGTETAPASATPAPVAPVASPLASTPSAGASQNAGEWRIESTIMDNSALPAVRALQVLLAAATLGTITKSEPTAEVIESGKFEMGTSIIVWVMATNDTDFAEQVTKSVGNISEVLVGSVTAPSGEMPQTAASSASAEKAGGNPPDGWCITVTLDATSPLPAARALQTVMACAEFGTVVTSDPSLETIENGTVIATAPITVWMKAPGNVDEITERAQHAVERVPEVQVSSVVATYIGVASQFVAPKVANAPSVQAAAPRAAQPAAPTAMPAAAPAAAMQNEASTPPNKVPEHAEADTTRQPAAHAPRMIRIDVERLDALMNLVGELVIDRTRLARISAKVSQHSDDPVLSEELTETCRHLARISDDLQDEVMRSRMLPIESVFSKFPRLMRDLAQKVSKKIDFIVEGKDTELDRSVAEQIGDPIIHLLRNSIDHGSETTEQRLASGKPEAGQVRLAARHEENQIVIDVEDDGRGIDIEVLKNKAVSKGVITPEIAARMSNREALDLIFASGFSTAETITDISGRGVGMDIVRTNVERLNGTIAVETEVGSGTRFTVRLPLTLAIIRALLINVNGQTYAIPLTSVVEALRIERDKLRSVNGHEAIELRGQVLPLMRLREIFAELTPSTPQHEQEGDGSRQFVVAVRWGERRSGLIVDSLIGEQEIVIKPLGNLFRTAHGVSGGAVLGDGKVAPILDVSALIKHCMAQEREVAVPQRAKA